MGFKLLQQDWANVAAGAKLFALQHSSTICWCVCLPVATPAFPQINTHTSAKPHTHSNFLLLVQDIVQVGC